MNSDSSSGELMPETRNTTAETVPSSDLRILETRLRTFENRWPLNWLAPLQLAQAGFFYFNIGDQVKCAFCGGIIGQWEINDLPLEEHRKFFPDCPVIRAQEVQEAEVIEEDSGIQSVRTPKSPEFSTLDSRIRSYANWDGTIQDPTILSQAGFYYLGTGDEVRAKKRKKMFPHQHVDINNILFLGQMLLL
jgi:baculoviral IAP repeat-containing protein 2/3